jgi:hypothetical protein
MSDFDCFVGIDWSGNKERLQKGLKIAVARPGSKAPKLVDGLGSKGRWSRADAVRWIKNLTKNERALIGMDFAFGFPPCGIPLDWEYVERMCCNDANFYGGEFFRAINAPHSHLVNSPWVPRTHPLVGHRRATEYAAGEVKGATPQSIFNAIGAAQVGPSSISGMRVLLHFKVNCGDFLSIWPFGEIDGERSAVVEVFPRYFPLSHKLSPKMFDHKALNVALAAFGSAPTTVPPASEDEGDALVTAAALRALSTDDDLFKLPNMSIRNEGWIFGVPAGASA